MEYKLLIWGLLILVWGVLIFINALRLRFLKERNPFIYVPPDEPHREIDDGPSIMGFHAQNNTRPFGTTRLDWYGNYTKRSPYALTRFSWQPNEKKHEPDDN